MIEETMYKGIIVGYTCNGKKKEILIIKYRQTLFQWVILVLLLIDDHHYNNNNNNNININKSLMINNNKLIIHCY